VMKSGTKVDSSSKPHHEKAMALCSEVKVLNKTTWMSMLDEFISGTAGRRYVINFTLRTGRSGTRKRKAIP